MQPGGPSHPPTLAERAASVAGRALREDRTQTTIVEMASELDRMLDEVVAPIQDPGGSPLACQPGCSHCCHRVVLCSLPEVIGIAAVVGQKFTEDQKSMLQERLYRYEREVAPSFGQDVHLLRPACPLLENDRCSIYEARPFFCRGINSTNAGACEDYRRHPHERPRIPMITLRLQAAQAVTSGLDHGLHQGGLPARPHDFGRALKIALEEPEVIQSWLDGGEGFEAAQSRGSSHNEPPARVQPVQRAYEPSEEPTGSFDASGLRIADYLSELGDHRSALSTITGTHPGYALARARLPLGYSSEADILEWRSNFRNSIRELATTNFDPREAFDGLAAYRPQDLSYQQFNNRDLLAEIGDLICNRISSRALPDLCAPIEGSRDPGRIRIGYAGYDLRESSLVPWALGWLKNQTDEFETFAINLGEIQDRHTLEFKRYACRYLHLPRTRPLPEAARLVKDLHLDVLIYLDAGAKSRTNQFASLRLARIQCSTWGGPETSGLPTIDYYLSSDLMEPPGAQEHYTEKLVRLPRSGVCYLPQHARASTLEKRDFGLGDGPLIVSLQPACKFDPQWDDLYRSINESTGRPVLIVARPHHDRKIVRERLARAGVQAAFCPHLSTSDYRALLTLADVVLDTPGWNGGITTIDALELQTPVVTLPTGLRRGRQSACFLELSRAPGLVASDKEDYVDLVSNSDRLHEAMRGLELTGMYNDIAAVRALEDFVRGVAS